MKTKYSSIFKSSIATMLMLAVSGVAYAESLYPLDQRYSNIANKVASNRGDILRVIVAESRSFTTSLAQSGTKESTINNQVNQFLFSTAASGFGTHNGELPKTDISGQNEYTSAANMNNTQGIVDNFSVMVTDILPNGNLVIQGARQLSTSGQDEFVTLTGIIRHWDVTVNNTVNSNQIYDLRVDYISEGTLRNTQKKGWLGKLNEILNPF